MDRRRPNVVVVLTDDQCWGDVGVHGNPHLATPTLDRLCTEGVDLTRFYTCTVCAPTRASLMTGRYNYRTRAIDTAYGRAMMDPEEVTLAEILRGAGYRTGLFGKWHLGDNYPMRAIDKGFEEVLCHRGGGMCQPSDFEGNSYFDPMLLHNGQAKKYTGYCTDVFADAAIEFVEQHRDEPFFVYLATNAPHSPLQIAEEWVESYRQKGLNETFARVYGMIENVDFNLDRLLAALERLGLSEDTIVWFMGDNGACGSHAHDGLQRYNAGLRDFKGSMYEGGIREPSLIRWPACLPRGVKLDRVAHLIDLVPTIAAACGVELPGNVTIDGLDLLPLLTGEVSAKEWPDRALFTQWHRGNIPERYRNCAVIGQQHKLVNGKELYDVINDSGETSDVAEKHPDIVLEMRRQYESWFDDVSTTRPDNYEPPRIHLGSREENPTVLTRQDWRIQGEVGWEDEDHGSWQVLVTRPGPYSIRLCFTKTKGAALAHVQLDEIKHELPVTAGATECAFEGVELPEGPGCLEAWVEGEGRRTSAFNIDVSRDG